MKDKGKVIINVAILLGFTAMGVVIGMMLQQLIIQATLMKVAMNMDGVEINVNFNETKMMDAAMENMEDILWDMRMENCTRTENNYCAIECYENSKLIPCQNFTGDEHFCSDGICEMNGVCPNYFERLEGKNIEDCMAEVVNNALEGDSA